MEPWMEFPQQWIFIAGGLVETDPELHDCEKHEALLMCMSIIVRRDCVEVFADHLGNLEAAALGGAGRVLEEIGRLCRAELAETGLSLVQLEIWLREGPQVHLGFTALAMTVIRDRPRLRSGVLEPCHGRHQMPKAVPETKLQLGLIGPFRKLGDLPDCQGLEMLPRASYVIAGPLDSQPEDWAELRKKVVTRSRRGGGCSGLQLGEPSAELCLDLGQPLHSCRE